MSLSLSLSLSLSCTPRLTDVSAKDPDDPDEAQGDEVSSDGSAEDGFDANKEYVVTRALKNDGILLSSFTQFELRGCVI